MKSTKLNHKNIIQEINNTVINIITELINNYIANKIDKGEKIFISSNKTNLENINFILGSSRFNFSLNIKNTVLEWGYNLTKDSNNYKLYLDIYSGGYSESSISYANEFYNTSIQGKLGNILIGMNIENDYSKDSVLIDYYIKYNNNSYIKYLYDITIFDSWKFCENEADCFLTKNDDYCPYIVKNEKGNKTIVKPELNGLEYNKNSSYYFYTGYYENNICSFSKYLFDIEDTTFIFNYSMFKNIN